MLRLRLKNPVPARLAQHAPFPFLASDYPLKPHLHRPTKRTPNPNACKTHPLAATELVTIDMEFDEQSDAFVTYVKELHGMSTYGKTELEALNNTAEMIRGYIKSMEANHKKIPLSAKRLIELKHLVGIR